MIDIPAPKGRFRLILGLWQQVFVSLIQGCRLITDSGAFAEGCTGELLLGQA